MNDLALNSDLIRKRNHAFLCSPFIKRLCEANEELEKESLLHISRPFYRDEMESWLNEKNITNKNELNQSLRQLRQKVIANIILRDLNQLATFDEVVKVITQLAEVALAFSHRHHFNWLQKRYGTPIFKNGDEQQLSIVGMGKLGGEELNVSSDIDLIFSYPNDGETNGKESISNQLFFIELAKNIIASIQDVTEDGFVFRVDMRLRPFGTEGLLACSYEMLEDYYQHYGCEWERYAWIKGRVLLGPHEKLTKIMDPFVYRKYLDYGAINSMRELKNKIQADVNRRGISENIKLGRGGIRKIEFIAQVYQLVRGGKDKSLRTKSLLATLVVLEAQKLLPHDVVISLDKAYIFLRNLEHRLQYMEDKQTQDLPKSDEGQSKLVLAMGYPNWTVFYCDLERYRKTVECHFDEVLKESIKHDESPRLNLARAIWSDSSSHEENLLYLESFNYVAINKSLQIIEGLRKSARYLQLPEISKQRFNLLMPLVISEVSLSKNPDTALVRIVSLLESICRRACYLALLVENPNALKLLIKLTHGSLWLTQYLSQHPVLIDELLNIDILYTEPNFKEHQLQLQKDFLESKGDIEQQMHIMRSLKNVTVFKLAALEVIGGISIERISDCLTELADLLLEQTLQSVWDQMHKGVEEPPRFAVIAYGKLGGKEMSYTSDLDIVFIYDDGREGAAEQYAKFTQHINSWLNTYTSSGVLYEIDLALRPDGASGLLVSSIEAFEDYQLHRAWTWEHQAITRARFCAGDIEVGNRFEKIRVSILAKRRDIEILRKDILSMRHKMFESYRHDTIHFNLKQDRGGMIDIEFIVQYFVLAFSSTHARLTQNIGNLALLNLLIEEGLLEIEDANHLASAYLVYRALQHQLGLDARLDGKVEINKVGEHPKLVSNIWNQIFTVAH